MNIQDAIKSGKPFRRTGWLNDGVFVMHPPHDIVLVLATDPLVPIELDVQDILADDWYIYDEPHAAFTFADQALLQPMQSHGRETTR